MNILTFSAIVKALTPISHIGENIGSLCVLRTEKVRQQDGSVEDIPIYSGNAIRGILRDISATLFLDRMSIAVSPSLHHILFAGGHITTGSRGVVDIKLDHDIRNTIPHISLFGSAFKNRMFGGKFFPSQMIPLCKETNGIIPSSLQKEQSIYESMQVLTFTRNDDLRTARGEKAVIKHDYIQDKDNPQQMIYSLQSLCAGTEFYWSGSLRSCSELEVSCFIAILNTYLKDPLIGGNAAKGLGRIEMEFIEDIRTKGSEDLYFCHIENEKESILDILKKMESL